MGKWNERTDREPDLKDEQAVMEFMREKYERKRWYVEDTPAKDSQEKSTKSTSLGRPPQREKKAVNGVSGYLKGSVQHWAKP